jgi:hypothetical protein
LKHAPALMEDEDDEMPIIVDEEEAFIKLD